MTACRPQRTLPWIRATALLVLVAGPASLPPLQAEPLPLPTPLNPAWAFDPSTPYLPGGAPASILLPNNGRPFQPTTSQPPQAISGPRPPIPPCPLIVPVRQAALQPLHLHPAQVPFKNSIGCLSSEDAIYGPDGCPKRLCGPSRGQRIALPPGGP